MHVRLAPQERVTAAGRSSALVVRLMAVFLVLLVPRASRADLELDGRWKQSALREDFTVQQWLEASCGPPPRSTTSGGGEVIDIRREGDELTFVGGGRVYRTNQCYDPMPTLSRETHSRDPSGKTWRTRCVTAPTDPRKAVLNTLVVATSDRRVDLVETGRYEITLEDGRCIADVKRTRSFTFAADEATPAATAASPPAKAAKAPEPPRPTTCDAPGAPSKLEVRPSRKLLRTGETFTFRSLVLDAKGCGTRTPTTWRIAPELEGKGVTVDASGSVTVRSDAQEGAGAIIATAAGKDARVIVEIVSPARYDELLARSGLDEAGEDEAASSVTIASQSLGAGEGRVEDGARARRMTFMAIIGGVLLALGVVALLLARRSRRVKALTREAEERHEARVKEVLDRRRQREAEHARELRAHEQSVATARAAAAAAAARPKTFIMPRSSTTPAGNAERICTSCGRRQPADTSFCPHDGAPLAPASEHGRTSGGPPASRGKICPTCGERFDGSAEFCGKDGTVLLLLN